MPLTGKGPIGPPIMPPRRPERAIAVAAFGTVLILQPFLGIFDKGAHTTVAGVPLLFAYLFFAWVVIIVLTAIVMERRQKPDTADDATPTTMGEATTDRAPTPGTTTPQSHGS